jgi:hypothetical protein
MAKGQWESRVGMLLNSEKHPEFVYSFKPVDSGMYGGQPRIDWLACDFMGRFWMIEVKQLDERSKRLNLRTEVSPGQKDGLNGVADSQAGVSLLAVGHGANLYLFDWRDIRWRSDPDELPLLLMTDAFLILTWTGPKSWSYNLYTLVRDALPSLIPAPTLLDRRLPKPEPSALT